MNCHTCGFGIASELSLCPACGEQKPTHHLTNENDSSDLAPPEEHIQTAEDILEDSGIMNTEAIPNIAVSKYPIPFDLDDAPPHSKAISELPFDIDFAPE